MSNNKAFVNRIKSLPRLSAEQIADFEMKLQRADSSREIAELFHNELGIDQDHLDFLREKGDELGDQKKAKLREFYYEDVKFDIENDVTTALYIPESQYKAAAQTHPEDFANPDSAKFGVKHRTSLTSVVLMAFNKAGDIIRNAGLTGKPVLFDMGCGTGKPILIGMSPKYKSRLNLEFQRAVGVEYQAELVDKVQQNLRSKILFPGAYSDDADDTLEVHMTPEEIKAEGKKEIVLPEIDIRFEDAAAFRDYNGINVVYMYNPFGEPIVKELERNLRTSGGSSIVLYNKPVHGNIFSKEKGWKEHWKIDNPDPDHQLTVYTSSSFHTFDRG